MKKTTKTLLIFTLVTLCYVFLQSTAFTATQLVLYPSNPDPKGDGKISATINGEAVTFQYQHTYHPESYHTKGFYTNYIRFAADGPVDVNLTVNETINTAYLRTVGKDLDFIKNGSNFQFTLPGPGNYYLQLPDLNSTGNKTYTVVFFFDDLAVYNSYQTAFAAAKNVLDYGIVSNYIMDQTGAIQNLINSRGSIYFPPGIYRTGQLNISGGTTIYLAPGALLKGTDNYNSSRYIYASGSNIKIAGLGAIDVNGKTTENSQTKGHGIDMESCSDLTFNDFIIYDSNSWMLHIRKCDRVYFNNVKVFSGKDGVDPDGSRDVTIQGMFIQSIDDGFAVKSKFSGRSCERVTMRDCIVFSIASALKIGTENYYNTVRDITWDNCDAVDSDRGCILYTKQSDGLASIQNITWRNIRIFNYGWSAETGGAPFQFDKNSDCSISNLLLENIIVYPKIGCYEDGVSDVTFRNIIMNGSSDISQGLKFEGVIWPNVTSESRPVVFIEPSTRNQNEFANGDTVTVTVQHPYSVQISSVELFVDNISVGTKSSSPYTFTLSGLNDGEHTLKATATDNNSSTNTTAPKRIVIISEDYLLGDSNCDGSVTPADALLAFQFYIMSETPATTPCDQKAAADITQDGVITPSDALCIFKEYLHDPC